MNAKQLKDSILQYAMQGKLVTQNPSDEPASKLLKRITAEKELLIKEGIIKKEKSLSPIMEEDIPFDIPDSWEWVRLGDISTKIHYGYTASASSNGNAKLLRITDIQNNSVFWDEVPYCTIDDNKLKSLLLQERDILIARTGGTIGKSYLIQEIDRCSVFASYLIRVQLLLNIFEVFISYYLQSPLYWTQLIEMSAGTGQPNVNAQNLKLLLVPLPPFEEQKRIVAKIEKLIPYLDQYDNAYLEVEKLNTQFPTQLEKSILQYAMQGKLVEQDFNDEPAQQLIEKIQLEKEQLIKEKVIKKEKPLPPITEEEVPFDIPSSWEWVRLKDLTQIIGDGLHGTPKYDNQGDYYFINGSNLKNNRIVFNDQTKRVSKETYELYSKTLDHRTILMSINGTLGSLAKYQGEPVMLGKSAAYITLITDEILDYIYVYFQSPVFKEFYEKKYTGTTIKNIPLSAIRECPVPLPPLSEQKRIVTAIVNILQVKNKLI